MKRWIHAAEVDLYDDEVESRRDGKFYFLGPAAMTGVENLAIFEDDLATEEELADALVEYMDKYYVLNDNQRSYVRTLVSA